MAGASDIGSIIWNNAPKKYSSRGNFTFEGLDLINLLGEKENISISDTLLDIIEVKSETETYTTKLYSRFHVGGSYDLNDLLSFNAFLFIVKKQLYVSRNIWKDNSRSFFIVHTR